MPAVPFFSARTPPKTALGRTFFYMERHISVWIDQDLCTGDGLCVDHAPDVFVMLEDGIAYVCQDGEVLNDPGGAGSLAAVPTKLHESAIAAAVLCPGECIFIEIEDSDHSSQTVKALPSHH
jgi:ferredoxin